MRLPDPLRAWIHNHNPQIPQPLHARQDVPALLPIGRVLGIRRALGGRVPAEVWHAADGPFEAEGADGVEARLRHVCGEEEEVGDVEEGEGVRVVEMRCGFGVPGCQMLV